MGCVLGLLSSSLCTGLACCCTGTAVSCCCRGCCSCKNSTSTRIVYACFLLVAIIVSGIILIPDVQKQLVNLPQLSGRNGSEGDYLLGINAIYRCFFAEAIFFLLMALVMIDVRSSRDCRAGLQNGFWFFKLTGIIAMTVGAFYLPFEFAKYWMYICIVSSMIYIIIQLIITVDFAYYLNEYLGDLYESTGNKCFAFIMVFITVTCYGMAATIFALSFVYYTSTDGCHENKVLLSLNICICAIFSIISIVKKVQEKTGNSGLLQSSILSLYVMFITWTALSNQPQQKCNPGLANILRHGNDYERYEFEQDHSLYLRPESILALLLSSLCILYSALRNSSASSKLFGFNKNNNQLDPEQKEIGHVYDDEHEETRYSYSFFHLIMGLAAMYTTMCLTNWMDPASPKTRNILSNATAFWFKAVSSWICMMLYIWSLVAPLIFSDRVFS